MSSWFSAIIALICFNVAWFFLEVEPKAKSKVRGKYENMYFLLIGQAIAIIILVVSWALGYEL